jgi:sn1-specific diacylglycerol lipase
MATAASVAPPAASFAASLGGLATGAMAAASIAQDKASPYFQQVSGKIQEVSNKVTEETTKRTEEALKTNLGEEVYNMFLCLQTCTAQLKEELNLATAQYGVMAALPLVHLHDVSHPKPASQKACNPNASEVDKMQMAQGRYWLEYACGAYGSGEPSATPEVQVNNELKKKGWSKAEVLYANLPTKDVMPGHFVAVDKEMRAVVLGIRGTTTAYDAIIDAVGTSEDMPEVPGLQVHKAMYEGAKKVLEKTRDELTKALNNNPNFQLIVTGHSLGAGTATLCSILLTLNPLIPAQKLTCFAYAPPPVLSNAAHEKIKGIKIVAYVNRNDAVPRASLHNVYQLGKKCMKIDLLDDLTLMDRLGLMRRGHADDLKEKKDKCVAAAYEEQEATKKNPGKFPPLFVGGDIYWIDGPNPAEAGGEWPAASAGVSDPANATLNLISANELQSLLLRGGKTMGTDHLGGNYGAGMDACGAKVDVEALMIQAKKDTDPPSAEAKCCCSVQ